MAGAAPVTPAQSPVVTFPAEIDVTNAGKVRRLLYAALATGAPIVVADLAATRYCDSMGLRALVLAHQRAAANGAQLRVAVSAEEILRIMAITKLDTVLRIYPSPEEAVADGTG
jgi:anti-anti-sigma factor